jgi:hypothetical protein
VRGQLQIPAIAHHSLASMFLYIPALEKKRLKQLNFLECPPELTQHGCLEGSFCERNQH